MQSVPVALFSHQDFRLARAIMPEFEAYSDYDDWLDSRYGRMMGLAMAGVETSLVSVTLADFLPWCAERDQLPTEEGLDAFAVASNAPPYDQAEESHAQAPIRLAL